MIGEAFSQSGGVAFFYILIWAFICGGVGRLIGRSKNLPGEGTGWGLLLGPVGWLVIALRKPAPDPMAKTCPFCAEPVRLEAVVCKHCGRDLDIPEAATTPRWAKDPYGRFQMRYWDGSAWTSQVSNHGRTFLDTDA